MRREGHDSIALINRLQILSAEIEFPGPAMMRRRFLLLVLAEGVLVNVEEKFGRGPFYLRGPGVGVSRTIRKSQQVQYLVLHLAFLTLADHTMHHRLIEAVVHVQATHSFGAAKVDGDCHEDQQSEEKSDRHPDDVRCSSSVVKRSFCSIHVPITEQRYVNFSPRGSPRTRLLSSLLSVTFSTLFTRRTSSLRSSTVSLIMRPPTCVRSARKFQNY